MAKVKFTKHITENQVDDILTQKYQDHKCPECGKNGLYAGAIDTQYDDPNNEYIVLSFNVFCKECSFVTMFRNSNEDYWFK